MQVAVIEFARNVCGLEGADSTEFVKDTPHPVICLQEEQRGVTDMGATMRLGTCVSDVRPGTRAFDLYRSATISERHRHRYEVNNDYRDRLEAGGLTISATSPGIDLVEMVEIAGHPFYLACQFHPEFLSKLSAPHPLFRGFVAAALERSQRPAPQQKAQPTPQPTPT
jgi:CTP synthase